MTAPLAGTVRARLLAQAWAFAAALLAGACGASVVPMQEGGTLAKPANVYVAEFETDAALELTDPPFSAQLRQRMPGLTEQAVRIELHRRAGRLVAEQIVAELRGGGMQASIGTDQNLRVDEITLVVGGKLRNAAPAAAARGRPAAAPRNRAVADVRAVYVTSGVNMQNVLTLTAEDGGGRTTGAPAPAPTAERLSPDLDAHLRRVAQTVAQRVLALAAERGWARPTAAPPAPAARGGAPRTR